MGVSIFLVFFGVFSRALYCTILIHGIFLLSLNYGMRFSLSPLALLVSFPCYLACFSLWPLYSSTFSPIGPDLHCLHSWVLTFIVIKQFFPFSFFLLSELLFCGFSTYMTLHTTYAQHTCLASSMCMLIWDELVSRA